MYAYMYVEYENAPAPCLNLSSLINDLINLNLKMYHTLLCGHSKEGRKEITYGHQNNELGKLLSPWPCSVTLTEFP